MKAGLVSRTIGAVALALLGWQIGSLTGTASQQPRNAVLGIAAGVLAGVALSPFIITRPYRALRRHIGSMPPGDLLYSLVGVILGLVAAALLSFPISFLPWWFGRVLPVIVAIVCVYLGVMVMTMRHRELTRYVRSPIRDQLEEPAPRQVALLVDTSAIIDGRIADISHTGFLPGTLVIPRFVLQELQRIADSPDPIRRNRGRRGLDMLNKLQKDPRASMEITDQDANHIPDVDGKLVELARKLDGQIITNDFNLNRVAELQGVSVLNINELANALKPIVLPGEEMDVHIIQEGKEFNQGVAYLDDGTMIVVENGRRYLHSHIAVVVTRVLQTVAGRMIFAHPKSEERV